VHRDLDVMVVGMTIDYEQAVDSLSAMFERIGVDKAQWVPSIEQVLKKEQARQAVLKPKARPSSLE